jgi:hypothetical protein
VSKFAIEFPTKFPSTRLSIRFKNEHSKRHLANGINLPKSIFDESDTCTTAAETIRSPHLRVLWHSHPHRTSARCPNRWQILSIQRASRWSDNAFSVHVCSAPKSNSRIACSAVLPNSWFPRAALEMNEWYKQQYKDPVVSVANT